MANLKYISKMKRARATNSKPNFELNFASILARLIFNSISRYLPDTSCTN